MIRTELCAVCNRQASGFGFQNKREGIYLKFCSMEHQSLAKGVSELIEGKGTAVIDITEREQKSISEGGIPHAAQYLTGSNLMEKPLSQFSAEEVQQLFRSFMHGYTSKMVELTPEVPF